MPLAANDMDQQRASNGAPEAARPTPLSLFHSCPPPVLLAACRPCGPLCSCSVSPSASLALATLALAFRMAYPLRPRSRERAPESSRSRIAESLAAPVILGSLFPDKTERPNAERRTSYGLYIPRILADAPYIQPACRGLRPPGPPPEKGAAPLWTIPGAARVVVCLAASLSWPAPWGGGIA